MAGAYFRHLRTSDNVDVLVPVDDHAREVLAAFPLHSLVRCDTKNSRHPGQHRLFFGLMKAVSENTDKFGGDPEMLRTWLKTRLGYVDTLIGPDGTTYFVPKSMAYDSMPQDEFKAFLDRAMDVIATEVIPGADIDALISEAARRGALRRQRKSQLENAA